MYNIADSGGCATGACSSKDMDFCGSYLQISSLYRHNPNHALDFHTDKNALRNSRKQIPLLTAFQEIRVNSLSERERKLTEFERVSSGS
jgi:hypothetical protein